jgi:N-acetylglucosaminyl-diphospho-decaprenol L-rhamnosyltransferase
MDSLLVVSVNYRVGPLCVKMMESVHAEFAGRPGCRLVIVDNASGDGSAELIEAAIRERGWQDRVELLRSPVNGGFSAGNNLAIRPALAGAAPPRYVLLLNPDTVVRPGAIETLWRFLEEHPRVGIAGSRLEDEDGTQQHSRYRFPSLWSEVDGLLSFGPVSRLLRKYAIAEEPAPVTEQVDWIAGASMMIRREVFAYVGLLDEGYFMYFEELDFCLHARAAGWPCWFVAESRILHWIGRSSAVDQTYGATRRMPDYWFRSRRRFWVKNHGYAFALFLDAVAVGCDALRRVRLWLLRKPDRKAAGFARGVLRMGLSRGDRGPQAG